MVRIRGSLTARLMAFMILPLWTPICSGCAQWLLPSLRVISCSLDEQAGISRVRFSAPPTRESIYKSFAMTEDGTHLEGRFAFEGEELRFYPVNGIRPGREYAITISAVAEDHRGNSLEEEYHQAFSTKAEEEAPRIIRALPVDASILTEAPAEIRLSFSESVDPHSFDNALRISPAISYVIQWEEDYREALIRPVKPLNLGKRYTISVSTALQDRARNTLLLPFTSSFLLGDGRILPRAALAWSAAAAGGPLLPGVLNQGLPADAEFSITFDCDVDIESLAGYIELQPSLGINLTADKNSRSGASIRFTQKPAWGETYTLLVRRGIAAVGGKETAEDLLFPLLFNAPEFMPPGFLGGTFKGSSESKNLSRETDFDFLVLNVLEYPSTGTPAAAELCLVFEVSEEAASLAPASAMGAFSLSVSNSCAAISIKTLGVLDEASYRGSGFNDPALTGGTGKKLCALVYGLEIENSERRGLIVFSITTLLKDGLGNSPREDIHITWNKS
jgi:hypothetical protein